MTMTGGDDEQEPKITSNARADKVYGSPWQPKHCNMAYNLNRGNQLAEKWQKIPSDCNILITHCPPYGILDECVSGKRVGCEALRRFHDEALICPRLHVFGHIHEQHGEFALFNVVLQIYRVFCWI
jgi:hypothetical protein